jgi:bifunctional non-homologous end joining protein LigD
MALQPQRRTRQPNGSAEVKAQEAERAAAHRDSPPSSVRADVSAANVPGAQRAALPKFIKPQLATLVTKAPTGEQWLHEIKYDGYRILARLEHGKVRLMSRNGRDWTDHFPAVAAGVSRLAAEQAMLDGEVAVILPDGTTSFQALQNALSGSGHNRLVYMVFDLLHLDGHDLTDARLEDRKALLKRLIEARGSAPLRYSDHVVGSGPEFIEHSCRAGLEGAVSKRRDAPYRGTRGSDWLKIKCLKQQEVVIGGYTDPEGTRIGLGALLGGVYEGSRLVYAGKIGTGFSSRTLLELKKRLESLAQATCPFDPKPTGVARAHWVKPELVAQVAFSEWTGDGKMRHPSFLGLREDKPAREVVRERALQPEQAVTSRAKSPLFGASDADPTVAAKTRRETSGQSHESKPSSSGTRPGRDGHGAVAVAGVRLTHPDRVLYPPQGTTKLGLARFYESIAEWILPHLKDRPTTLVRCPEGTQGECFYQKHVSYWAPDSVRRVKIRQQKKIGDYLVVDDLPALIGLVQIGILEIHTWNSVVEQLERPDRIVLDLDPGPGVDWPRVIDAARLVRARLEAVGLQSFVKTTGSKGLHVVVPLNPGTTWEEGSAFARAVAESMVRDDPRAYIARMAKAERRGKIFIDYLRNVRGATSVAAYSTRAKPEATVSVPLDWDELSAAIRSDHYTIANLSSRLRRLKADPWARYWTIRQKLPSVGAIAADRPGPRTSKRRRQRSDDN